jgi:hypothetical protein
MCVCDAVDWRRRKAGMRPLRMAGNDRGQRLITVVAEAFLGLLPAPRPLRLLST